MQTVLTCPNRHPHRAASMQGLAGKVAIITGASRGIGHAVAARLHAGGARVVLTYLPGHGEAQDVIRRMEPSGERAFALAGDLRSNAFIKELFEETARRWGPPDIVVANAGVNLNKLIADATGEDFDHIFSLNARATFFVFREAARRIQDGGRIIGISSNMTLQGRPGAALYAASKAAVEQFVRILAKEMGARKVTVNAVAPGPTDTSMVSQLSRETAPSMTPLGRLGRPEEVADAVAFLASEQGRWITGQIIGVNGGIV